MLFNYLTYGKMKKVLERNHENFPGVMKKIQLETFGNLKTRKQHPHLPTPLFFVAVMLYIFSFLFFY